MMDLTNEVSSGAIELAKGILKVSFMPFLIYFFVRLDYVVKLIMLSFLNIHIEVEPVELAASSCSRRYDL